MARAQAALRARPGTRNRALPTGCLLALACLADATALEDDSAASSASLLSRLLLAAAYLGLLMGALRLLRDLVDKHLRAWARRTDTQVDDAIVAVLQHESEGGLVFAYGVIAAWLAARSAGLDLVDTPIANAEPFVRLLVLLLASWRASTIAYGIIAAALGGSAADSRKNAEHGRAVELVLKGTQLALLCIAGLFVCDNLGVSVNSVLGAMGVLSITGSLSSQAVLTDAISYFAVSLDKPFEVGDYVKVSGSKMARVLSVGWKTTRLRALDGELLVFTNSDIAKSRLSNYKGMDRRRTKVRAADHPREVHPRTGTLMQAITDTLTRIRTHAHRPILPFEPVQLASGPRYARRLSQGNARICEGGSTVRA